MEFALVHKIISVDRWTSSTLISVKSTHDFWCKWVHDTLSMCTLWADPSVVCSNGTEIRRSENWISGFISRSYLGSIFLLPEQYRLSSRYSCWLNRGPPETVQSIGSDLPHTMADRMCRSRWRLWLRTKRNRAKKSLLSNLRRVELGFCPCSTTTNRTSPLAQSNCVIVLAKCEELVLAFQGHCWCWFGKGNSINFLSISSSIQFNSLNAIADGAIIDDGVQPHQWCRRINMRFSCSNQSSSQRKWFLKIIQSPFRGRTDTIQNFRRHVDEKLTISPMNLIQS